VTGPYTRAESSRWTATSLHADVVEFIERLAERRDPRLAVTDFGASPEGRSLPLLVLSAHGFRTPAESHASGLPVVLVINGIHAGEVEGKEASLMLVRDILDGADAEMLERLTLVVVPLFNPDGNDRIDPANRRLDIDAKTGQIGPDSGVGTRTTAAGINLNRDWLRHDAPEMRALFRGVFLPWNAHLVVDCHATNGSIHRFALTYDVPHVPKSGSSAPIDHMSWRFLPAVTRTLKEREGLQTFWYGNFLRDEGGRGEGWITYPHHPRFGGNYRGLVNRLDLLLETYSYLPFEQRVRTTYAFLRETLREAARDGRSIVELLRSCIEPPREVAVRYRLEARPDAKARILTREPYTLEGAAISVDVPHFAHFVPDHTVRRPLAYAVPRALVERLEGHGLVVSEPEPAERFDLEVARVLGRASEEGRGILEAAASGHLEVRWRRERRPLAETHVLVSASGQRGAVACYLLEPESDDGVVECGWLPAPAAGADFPIERVLARER
jgi:hypothetical protein